MNSSRATSARSASAVKLNSSWAQRWKSASAVAGDSEQPRDHDAGQDAVELVDEVGLAARREPVDDLVARSRR